GLGSAVSLPALQLRTFAVRRARRILPPYFAAVALFSLLPLWNPWAVYVHRVPTALELGSHLLLVHNLFPSTVLSIDGPLWSLALDAQLYVAFPVLVGLFRHVGAKWFLAAVLAFSLTFRLAAWELLDGKSLPFESQFALMGALPGHLFEFSAGMAAAYLITR